MLNEETVNVKADLGNAMIESELEAAGVYSDDEASASGKVVIKVLKRQKSAGLESVTIQLGTLPGRADETA